MTPHPACFFGDSVRPVAVLPGSFNPLHRGHRLLAEVAGRRLGTAVPFELSTANMDRPSTPAADFRPEFGGPPQAPAGPALSRRTRRR